MEPLLKVRLVNDQAILLADEPTGNLDSKSGKELMALILNLNQTRSTTVVVVMHAPIVRPRPIVSAAFRMARWQRISHRNKMWG